MNIRGKEVKIDKGVLAKAVGIMCLGWLALIPLYIMLKKRKTWGEEKEVEIKTLKKQIEKELKEDKSG